MIKSSRESLLSKYLFAGVKKAVNEEQAKIVFLTSPNNPDGSMISEDEVLEILQLPALIVLDEAYIEFSTVSLALSLLLAMSACGLFTSLTSLGVQMPKCFGSSQGSSFSRLCCPCTSACPPWTSICYSF